MNLVESILSANGGKAVTQIAKQLGIPEEMAKKATEAMSPALARGLQRNASRPGGLDSLLGALKTGKHDRYVDEPNALEREDTVADGNKILGHILGSKDVSRNVAGSAAKETGLDAGMLKKMLPMLGAVAMGALSKQANSGGGQGGAAALLGGGQGNPLGALSALLDTDKDGSPTDEILDLAKKFF